MNKNLLLLLLFLPISLWADKWTDTNTQLVYEYDPNGSTAVCVGGTSSTKVGTTITIPEKITIELDGKTKSFDVTAIGESAFITYSNLISVNIPNTVTTIGEKAFYRCTKLTNVNINNNITTIGKQAFYNCQALSAIHIPNGIETIEENVFYGCQALESISIPSSVHIIGNSAFQGCKGLKEIFIPANVKSIGASAFSGCTDIEKLTINNKDVDVASNSFSGLSRLKEITLNCAVIGNWFTKKDSISVLIIGEGAITISEDAFRKCSNLKTLNLPNTLSSIGKNAFYGCQELTSLVIPSSVTTMGSRAFYGCSGLETIVIGAGLSIIEDYTFQNCSSLKSITIPSNITSIGSSSFSNCDGIISLDLPQSVATIGGGAFGGCDNLESVTIRNESLTNGLSIFSGCNKLKTVIFHCPQVSNIFCANKIIENVILGDEVTAISDEAFLVCSNLSSIVFSPNLTSIGKRSFVDCNSLKDIVLPNQIKTIGDNAFKGCGISSINIPDNAVTIGSNAFSNCKNLTSIIIPKTISSIGSGAFSGCSNLAKVTFHCPEVKDWFRGNTCGINALKEVVLGSEVRSVGEDAFNNCRSLTSFVVPNGVTIAEDAFDNCSGLTKVTLHCTEVGNWFRNRPIKEIVWGDEVTIIGDYAFWGCSELESVAIPNGITSIGIYAFSSSGLKSVNFPNSVTSIGKKAFSGCPLSSVEIPSGISVIREGTFADCGSITSILIPDNITAIEAEAFYNCKALEEITIGKNVREIGSKAFCKRTGEKYSSIVSYIYDPFKLDGSAFSWEEWNVLEQMHEYTFMSDVPLYVPAGTKSKYKATAEWKSFKNLYEMTVENTVIVTANDQTMIYGDAIPELTFMTDGGTLSEMPTVSCEATSTSPVGTYPITVSGGSAANKDVAHISGTLTITKAPLIIKVGNYTKMQGEENPEFIIEYEGFKNNETNDVLTKQPTVTCSATKDSKAGKYKISVSGAQAQNYSITYVSGTLTITEDASVTVTAKSYTRIYGDANPTFEYTSSGASLNGNPEISCEATATSPVGTYPIIIKKGGVTNDNVSYVNGTLTITKAPLTVKVGNYTKQAGEENPIFTLTYEGFRNGETEAVLIQKPVATTTATKESTPGDYPITVSGGSAENYALSYVGGILTVTNGILIGDVNEDGKVNGTDLVALTNIILGKNPEKAAADVNGDKKVNGTDYVALVNIILGKASARQMTIDAEDTFGTASALSIEPFSIKAGETKEIAIRLTNPNVELTLLQFELTLPEGLAINKVHDEYEIGMGSRTNWHSHQLAAYEHDNTFRCLLSSNSNATIEGTEGTVFRMTVVANNDFVGGTIMLRNILGVTPMEREVWMSGSHYGLTANDTTGIYSIDSCSKESAVYSISGQRQTVLKKGINIVDGKKVIKK